jgi:fatty acid desaturase
LVNAFFESDGLLNFVANKFDSMSLSDEVIKHIQVASSNSLKKTQEHSNGLNTEPDPLLRSRTYFYPLSPLLSPFNINYHFEHHANFNVPWYLLPAYNKALLSVVPADLQPYYFHHEYLDQMAGRKALPPRELLLERESAIPAAR